MSRTWVQVAVAVPLPGPFTYRLPEELQSVIDVGHGVLVPFGNRLVSGFVVGFSERPDLPEARIKAVADVLSLERLFDPSQLPFFEWVSRYYLHPLGEVLRTAMPSGVQRSSRKRVVLTEAGEAAQGTEAGDLPVLDRLRRAGNKGLALRSVLTEPFSELGGMDIAAVLRRLERQGLIEFDQALSAARATVQHDTLYGLISVGDDAADDALTAFKRPGPVQQAVVKALAVRGSATASEIRADLRAMELNAARLPAVLKQLVEAGKVRTDERERVSLNRQGLTFADKPVHLSADQQRAVKEITAALEAGSFQSFLLQGVTGSGKTEVYLRLAKACLELGRPAIILVPEISLTPQLLGRFQAQFGEDIACLHSDLTDQERYDAWRRIARSEVQLALGARSAVFAPFEAPGLIVVDEEHDHSFKQDDGLRYNGRDLAVLRARHAGGVVVLGSATPSLETRHNADRGVYRFQPLPSRVGSRPLPEVIPVDMRLKANQPQEAGGATLLAPELHGALLETFKAGHQAILLLNRRGFAPFVLCPRCGGGFHCTQCDVSLTYHRKRHLLLCHHCGAAQRLPEQCPQCGYHQLELSGTGTERLEDELETLLPGVSVARLDRDTAGRRDAFLSLLQGFRKGETQLLIGTQMVAKGHDFPGVTTVGILQADYLLNLPDFRASERTFQLVTQVSGRAGRGENPGRVYVQSHTPEHYSLAFAAQHDYDGFYEHEARLRQLHSFPPFSRLAIVHVSGKQEWPSQRAADEVAEAMRQLRDGDPREKSQIPVQVRGPAPSPLARVAGWWRFQILISAPSAARLQRFMAMAVALPQLQNPPRGTRIGWDVDPSNLL